jgi:hypothetical protein
MPDLSSVVNCVTAFPFKVEVDCAVGISSLEPTPKSEHQKQQPAKAD